MKRRQHPFDVVLVRSNCSTATFLMLIHHALTDFVGAALADSVVRLRTVIRTSGMTLGFQMQTHVVGSPAGFRPTLRVE